jgi:hypothetical protein
LKFLSSKETEDITYSSKSKDSHGYEILIQILKASSLYISSPLTYLCKWMLSSGIFPSRLKFSEIKPLFKKAISLTFIIIDLSLSLHPFPKLLKRLFVLDLLNA